MYVYIHIYPHPTQHTLELDNDIMHHDSFMYDMILDESSLCAMHSSCIRFMTHAYVTWPIHVWRNSFTCDMTHSYVTWLIHMWNNWFIDDTTHWPVTSLSVIMRTLIRRHCALTPTLTATQCITLQHMVTRSLQHTNCNNIHSFRAHSPQQLRIVLLHSSLCFQRAPSRIWTPAPPFYTCPHPTLWRMSWSDTYKHAHKHSTTHNTRHSNHRLTLPRVHIHTCTCICLYIHIHV